jgi:hypothetical protein
LFLDAFETIRQGPEIIPDRHQDRNQWHLMLWKE